MIFKTNSKQYIKASKSGNLASVSSFLNFALYIAIIFCSTLTVQSAESSAIEPLNSNDKPIPELNKKDRASIINSGDTVVFDYSQAVFANGNLKFPVSIITDDPDVFALDFQFSFNNVDFTYDTVLNTNNLTSLLGNFNPTDLKLRVSSFDLDVLPNNTNLVTLSFNTTSTQFCALNPYDVIVYLNGEPCSYKIIGCANESANAGLDQNICAESTFLTANSIFAGTASWSVISGSGTFANPNLPATSVSGLSAGANIFRWTFPGNSNTDSTFDDVNIFRNIPPSIAIAGDDYSACGNSTNLPAEIPTTGTGAWTLLEGTGSIQDFTDPNSVFTFTLPGLYELEWRTSSGNCPETADTIKITKLESANAGADIFVCESQTTLTAIPSSTSSGYWSVVSGTGVFVDSTSATTNVSGMSPGENIFSWTLSIDNCPDDSTDLVSVTVNELSEAIAGVDQTVCGDSALLGAVNPTIGSGIWSSVNASVIFTDASNYQTTVSNLSFGVDTLIWTTTNGICTSVDTVIITSFEQTSLAEAGNNQSVCGNSSQLEAVSPTIGSGIWSSVSASVVFADSSNYQTIVSNLSLGIDTLIWTITNGVCTSVDTAIITSIELPEAFAGVDQTICGDSVLLEAVNPTIGSGIWTSTNPSVIFADSSNFQTTVNNLSFGVDTLFWTTNNGLCIAADTVIITSFEQASIAEAGEDQTVCGDNAQLEAVNPTIGSGTWSSVNPSVIFADVTNYQTTVSNLSIGVDTLIWTTTNGICSSIDSVIITSIELPIAFAGVDQSVCGDNAQLEALNPTIGNGIWSSVNASVIFADATNSQTTVSILGFGVDTLIWTITNGVCTAADSIIINSFEQPSLAEAGEDQTVCGDKVQLAAVKPVIGNGTWSSVNPSVIFTDATDFQTLVSSLSYGLDTLIWTTSNGICTSVDTVIITSVVQPQAFAGLDTVICAYQQPFTIPISITGSTNWTWAALSGNAAIDNELSLFPSFSNMALGQNNSFELLATNGQCSAIDTLNIFVYANESEYCLTSTIFIPEGFSPNGDGSYDVFAILNLNGLDANVQIYNRWGNLVYANENYQNDWNGTANQGLVLYGEELPAGTYYYIIQIEGESEPRKDYLTLWR